MEPKTSWEVKVEHWSDRAEEEREKEEGTLTRISVREDPRGSSDGVEGEVSDAKKAENRGKD